MLDGFGGEGRNLSSSSGVSLPNMSATLGRESLMLRSGLTLPRPKFVLLLEGSCGVYSPGPGTSPTPPVL